MMMIIDLKKALDDADDETAVSISFLKGELHTLRLTVLGGYLAIETTEGKEKIEDATVKKGATNESDH